MNLSAVNAIVSVLSGASMQGTNPSHHMLDVISAETRDSNSILDCQDNSMAETSTLLLGLFSSS